MGISLGPVHHGEVSHLRLCHVLYLSIFYFLSILQFFSDFFFWSIFLFLSAFVFFTFSFFIYFPMHICVRLKQTFRPQWYCSMSAQIDIYDGLNPGLADGKPDNCQLQPLGKLLAEQGMSAQNHCGPWWLFHTHCTHVSHSFSNLPLSYHFFYLYLFSGV